MPFTLSLMPATHFKQVGTGATKGWESCSNTLQGNRSIGQRLQYHDWIWERHFSKGSVVHMQGWDEVLHMFAQRVLLHGQRNTRDGILFLLMSYIASQRFGSEDCTMSSGVSLDWLSCQLIMITCCSKKRRIFLIGKKSFFPLVFLCYSKRFEGGCRLPC